MRLEIIPSYVPLRVYKPYSVITDELLKACPGELIIRSYPPGNRYTVWKYKSKGSGVGLNNLVIDQKDTPLQKHNILEKVCEYPSSIVVTVLEAGGKLELESVYRASGELMLSYYDLQDFVAETGMMKIAPSPPLLILDTSTMHGFGKTALDDVMATLCGAVDGGLLVAVGQNWYVYDCN